jgi:hypothetical protein
MALKIGTEDKKKVAIVAALGVVVLGLVIYNVISMFSGGSTPPPAPAPTVAKAPAVVPVPQTGAAPGAPTGARVIPARRAKEATKISGSMENLDPTLHPELMAQAESLEYSGKGRNIFSMNSAPVIEVAQAPARPEPVVPQGPVGPPPPPPIDLKFFGYETHQGGAKKVFLLHGEDVFIAAEGDVVDHHYRVVKIAPLSVQVQDIPYNNTQTLPLIQN